MKLAFVVLGMHRSGTSSVAGLLALLGATAPKTLMAAKPENPKGFWESEVLMAFNDEILTRAGSAWDDSSALDTSIFEGEEGKTLKDRAKIKLEEEFADADTIVIKDPRICRFYPFWREVLEEAGYSPFVILPVRKPAEVAASLHGRNGMPIEQGLALWRRHVEDAEAASRGYARHVLIWNELLQNWEATRDALEAALGHPLGRRTPEEQAEIARFLSPDVSKHLGKADLDIDGESLALFERMKQLASG